MAEKASHVLTEQALNLQTKYHHLLELIQYLAQDANVDIVKTKLRTILEEKSLYQLHGISHYLQAIKGITNINEAFTFLVDNHFIGYLNYQLLKEFAKSKVICGDGYKKAKEKVLKYEKLYRKFIEELSFCWLIEVFDENPHLNPCKHSGRPTNNTSQSFTKVENTKHKGPQRVDTIHQRKQAPPTKHGIQVHTQHLCHLPH